MQPIAPELRRRLRSFGVSAQAIEAIWPEWWSADAEASLSAQSELRFTVARRLGIAPATLFEESPRFVWRDDARFKNLGDVTETEQSILSSFGMALGRVLISATRPSPAVRGQISAGELRGALLNSSPFVGLGQLLTLGWGIGIPIVKIAVYPLKQKRMHAMSVSSDGRFAVILGQDTDYPARVAFALAHELGHIMLGHVSGREALLDVDDPLLHDGDSEESAADAYALELLTGSSAPVIQPEFKTFGAAQLARAAREISEPYGIDPGIIALCVGHETGEWGRAVGALKVLGKEEGLSGRINGLASTQLDWASLSPGSLGYIQRMLGFSHES